MYGMIRRLGSLLLAPSAGEGYRCPPGTVSREGAQQPAHSQRWIDAQLERSVASGRQSPESAAYFADLLASRPEFLQCLDDANGLMGGQDPCVMTMYQRRRLSEALGEHVSRQASSKLLQMRQEESQTKDFTQNGTPTGEKYWIEAGNVLSSPSIPPFVKDEILEDMRRDRSADSPAFVEPAEVAKISEDDERYAAYVRQHGPGTSSLFSGSDIT